MTGKWNEKNRKRNRDSEDSDVEVDLNLGYFDEAADDEEPDEDDLVLEEDEADGEEPDEDDLVLEEDEADGEESDEDDLDLEEDEGDDEESDEDDLDLEEDEGDDEESDEDDLDLEEDEADDEEEDEEREEESEEDTPGNNKVSQLVGKTRKKPNGSGHTRFQVPESKSINRTKHIENSICFYSNRGIVTKEALQEMGRPEYLEALYSDEEVALLPTTAENPKSYPVYPSGKHGVFYCKRLITELCKNFGWNISGNSKVILTNPRYEKIGGKLACIYKSPTQTRKSKSKK